MTKGMWSLPAGDYTARQVVQGFAPLLETVLHVLGKDRPGETTARHMLFDNLASNLATDTRESSLQIPPRDPGRKEMANQAEKIGKVLVEYARQVGEVPYDPKYTIRSPCEGHLLKPPVAQLMFGPRSVSYLMQIYNEYLHQMVLLRDSLLPFENFEEVVIPIRGGADKSQLGMRFTEPQRMSFLAELMTKSITQAAVFKVAQVLLAPKLSSGKAYGFQYKSGLVVPAVVVGGSSLRLLRYIPAVIDESIPEVAFEYAIPDYYAAPRTEIPEPEQTVDQGEQVLGTLLSSKNSLVACSFEVASTKSDERSRQLELHLEHDNGLCASVDVGQIARGWRYSYHVGPAHDTPHVKSFSAPCSVHSAVSVLTKTEQEGLVTSKAGGIHLIQAHSKVEILALLGRLYPDNVIILADGGSLEEVEKAGQSLPGEPRFVLQLSGKNVR
ncbi:hypothetical protein K461DRAFT_295932 [Myriangium duriaei CBS 260.36]|uniref:Uncharacterized protein n=1 Tax=Myriangium duriaei CBS 260.36 TaxID=1168546 RepID=A0A9P4IY96_9PEZI|nr:hypothetical protein K461DRAFT_295932 [Myriangium duriaei CBS 260.36]